MNNKNILEFIYIIFYFTLELYEVYKTYLIKNINLTKIICLIIEAEEVHQLSEYKIISNILL